MFIVLELFIFLSEVMILFNVLVFIDERIEKKIKYLNIIIKV